MTDAGGDVTISTVVTVVSRKIGKRLYGGMGTPGAGAFRGLYSQGSTTFPSTQKKICTKSVDERVTLRFVKRATPLESEG